MSHSTRLQLTDTALHMKNALIKATGSSSISVSITIYNSQNFFYYSYCSFLIAVARFPIKHIENNRLHSCISARVTHIFPRDNEFQDEDGSWCESEGEILDDENSLSDSDLPMTPTPLLVGVLSTIETHSHSFSSHLRVFMQSEQHDRGLGLPLQRSGAFICLSYYMSNLKSPSLAPATTEPNCVTADSSDFYGFVSSPLNLECAMGATPIA